MIKRWRQTMNKRYQKWIFRRLPPVKKIRLDNRKLFIFPTRAGFVFFALLVLLWLIATNFENNLVFAFTFLLASLFIVGVFHTFLNLSGLQIEGGRATPGFAGQAVAFEYLLSQTGCRQRYSIELSYPGLEPTSVALMGNELKAVYLSIPAKRRGWFQAQRITVKSIYPLGLLKVWTYLQFDSTALVYPQPIASPLPTQLTAGQGDNYFARHDGIEDFMGLEKYRPGESLRHIAWKQYAREQGLQTKHYADAIDDEVWLDWEAFPGLDTEARLSRLCALAVDLSDSQSGNSLRAYGLRLPNLELAPGSGRAHRDRVLRELALFELPQVSER